jgi:hypothetical protein
LRYALIITHSRVFMACCFSSEPNIEPEPTPNCFLSAESKQKFDQENVKRFDH